MGKVFNERENNSGLSVDQKVNEIFSSFRTF